MSGSAANDGKFSAAEDVCYRSLRLVHEIIHRKVFTGFNDIRQVMRDLRAFFRRILSRTDIKSFVYLH